MRPSRAGLKGSAWAPRENAAWGPAVRKGGERPRKTGQRRGLQPNKEKTAHGRHSPQSCGPSWPGSGTAGGIRVEGGARGERGSGAAAGEVEGVQSSAWWGGAEQSVWVLTAKRTAPTRRPPVPRLPFKCGERESSSQGLSRPISIHRDRLKAGDASVTRQLKNIGVGIEGKEFPHVCFCLPGEPQVWAWAWVALV